MTFKLVARQQVLGNAPPHVVKNDKCYPTFSSEDCDLDTTDMLKLFGLCIDNSQ